MRLLKAKVHYKIQAEILKILSNKNLLVKIRDIIVKKFGNSIHIFSTKQNYDVQNL
jgi:hypothetical protein